MNKNNIIDLLQKELEEMTTIFQNMRETASVPSVLFQLSNSKIENIKNLLENWLSDNGSFGFEYIMVETEYIIN